MACRSRKQSPEACVKSSILMAATALVAGLLSSAAAQGAPASTIVVGHLTLQSCNAAYGGYCGHLDRPFDPSGRVPGVVAIGFEYYPSSGTSGETPTILAEEGGARQLVDRLSHRLSHAVRADPQPAQHCHHRQARHRPFAACQLQGRADSLQYDHRDRRAVRAGIGRTVGTLRNGSGRG